MKTTLPIISAKRAAELAKEEVVKERSGKQFGLYCRYDELNIAMGKYFRFNTINLFAGLSGSGKSYLLNMLSEDFTNKELNKDFQYVPVILHFCFEMSAFVEVLRSCATELKISYSKLLSSDYNSKTKSYNILTDEEMTKVNNYFEEYEKRNIVFIEDSGNVKMIYNTVEDYYNKLQKRTVKIKNETGVTVVFQLIVNIDHSLLVETLDETSVLDLMANIGKLGITLKRKFGAMVNLLGQLNNLIEDTKRILTPALHYPQKSDIYAQGQLYNACDNVFVIHKPELLKIEFYGRRKLPTKDLIHLIKLKSRHGKIGSIWLKDNLANGTIDPFPKKDNSEDDKIIDNL